MLQEVEVNSNCKHLIASINSYVCFPYLIMHTLLFKYCGSLKKKGLCSTKDTFGGGGGCYGQLTLFRKQEKDVSFFHKGRIKIDTVVLSFLLRDKIAMVSHYSIVRGWQKLDRADEYQVIALQRFDETYIRKFSTYGYMMYRCGHFIPISW